MSTDIEETKYYIELARSFLPLFEDVTWAYTEPTTDEDHVAGYEAILDQTRYDFPEMPSDTEMHYISNKDGNIIYALTGNSPKAADRAKALTGFIKTMPDLLNVLEKSLSISEEVDQVEARISELLQHNNEQLAENRAQRETIRKLEGKVKWLMDHIPNLVVM